MKEISWKLRKKLDSSGFGTQRPIAHLWKVGRPWTYLERGISTQSLRHADLDEFARHACSVKLGDLAAYQNAGHTRTHLPFAMLPRLLVVEDYSGPALARARRS